MNSLHSPCILDETGILDPLSKNIQHNLNYTINYGDAAQTDRIHVLQNESGVDILIHPKIQDAEKYVHIDKTVAAIRSKVLNIIASCEGSYEAKQIDMQPIVIPESLASVASSIYESVEIPSVSNPDFIAPDTDINEIALYDEAWFASHYGSKLESLLASLEHSPEDTVILEGGHMYGDETFTNEIAHDLRCQALLAQALQKEGYNVTNTLFVDDYNIEPDTYCFDKEQYKATAENLGVGFDHELTESSMVDVADKMIEELDDYLVENDDGTVDFIDGETCIRLVKNVDGELKYTCALLDASCTVSKLSQESNGVSVVLLPSHWGPQQSAMKKLVEALGIKKNAAQTFYTS